MNSNLINSREIRKFGTIGLTFFGILFAVAAWRDKTLLTYFFGLLAALSTAFILTPGMLKPVYVGWLKIAHFIGSKVTLLILTLFFYLVITPAALLKRIFGGRPLPVRPDPDAETYWVTRTESAQPKDRFLKRF